MNAVETIIMQAVLKSVTDYNNYIELNTYDNLISVIEWLIGLGKFNENYLNCAE